MLTAEERLITLRVKIERAKKHFSDLTVLAEPYRYKYTHIVVSDAQPKFSTNFPDPIRVAIIPFDMLAVAGDILHNLRSALDHVVYHLALVKSPNVGDDILHRVEFPIGETLEKYESLRERKIQGVIEPRAVKFIDVLKPYKGGTEAFWTLNELNNIDKHRSLISVGQNGLLCEGDGFDGHYWLKADNPSFARVFLPDREQESKLPTDAKSIIEFHVAEREALIPTLHQLISFTECLIEQFRTFLEPEN